jgi:hypothetical protein
MLVIIFRASTKKTQEYSKTTGKSNRTLENVLTQKVTHELRSKKDLIHKK